MNNSLLLIIFSLISFCVGYFIAKGYNKRNLEIKSHFKYIKGIDFLLNNEPDKAIEELVNAAKERPDITELFLTLGNLFRQKGEIERALKLHQSILIKEDLPKEFKVLTLLNLIKDYKSGGFLNKALEIAEELEKIDKKNKELLQEKIDILKLKKDWNNLLNTLKKLEKVSGESQSKNISSVYCEIAKEYIKKEDFFKAKFLLKKAISIYCDNYYAYILLTKISLQKNKYDNAEEYVIKAIKINNLISIVLRNYINIIEKKLDRKIDILNKIVSPYRDYFIIRDKVLKNQIDEAINICLNLLRKNQLGYVTNMLLLLFSIKNKNKENIKFFRKNLYFNFFCSNCKINTKKFYFYCPNCREWLTYFLMY